MVSGRQRMAARKAAVEKSLAAYIKLECGHFTTREAQKFKPPRKGLYFCDDEKCLDWRMRWQEKTPAERVTEAEEF